MLAVRVMQQVAEVQHLSMKRVGDDVALFKPVILDFYLVSNFIEAHCVSEMNSL
jgi:hypothetical protein